MVQFQISILLLWCRELTSIPAVTLMHRAKRVNFGIMEECMVKIFHRLHGLIAYFQIAMGNAGQTLAPVLCKSMKEIIDHTLDLLECSMGIGPHSK